jgi:hypothetical protein
VARRAERRGDRDRRRLTAEGLVVSRSRRGEPELRGLEPLLDDRCGARPFWPAGEEVDFVARGAERRLTAIEVASGRPRDARAGLRAFGKKNMTVRKLLVGGDGIDLEEFLSRFPEDFIA